MKQPCDRSEECALLKTARVRLEDAVARLVKKDDQGPLVDILREETKALRHVLLALIQQAEELEAGLVKTPYAKDEFQKVLRAAKAAAEGQGAR